MTIQITRREIEDLLQRQLQSGDFRDAEEVILRALKALEAAPRGIDTERAEAIERLKTFGKKHKLSLGGLTIKELRDEARP